jgi:hypothetical protein
VGRGKRYIRLLIASGVAAIGLAVPGSAGAWEFYGQVGIGKYSGPCIFYWNMARCSGWNYWGVGSCTDYSGGTILCGFENTSRIRGVYLSAGQYIAQQPFDLGMGGYLLAHGTWWSGADATIEANAS